MKPKNSPIPKELPPADTILELTIDSLSYNGGRGVGRADGVVVFVPMTAPQDLVRVRVTSKKSRFWEAEVIEIIKPSPARRTAPCPVFARCGGCSWQHVEYGEQVEQKKQILAMSLRSLSKLNPFTTRPFLPAPYEFHYRNRIQLQVRGGRFGFFAKRSHDLVETNECWISDPFLNEKLKGLRPEEAAGAEKIELALGSDGVVHLSAGGRDPEAALFSQVNNAQNKVLKSKVVAAVHGKPEWIMDLYAGGGNLTQPLAERFSQCRLEAVELSRDSVAQARTQSAPSVQWHSGDVLQILTKWKPRAGDGLIVLDPPRVGCAATVIDQLLRHMPKQIIYVSCNPTTFARDAERLIRAGGYKLESVQALDMFPQTEHVELISSFMRV